MCVSSSFSCFGAQTRNRNIRRENVIGRERAITFAGLFYYLIVFTDFFDGICTGSSGDCCPEEEEATATQKAKREK